MAWSLHILGTNAAVPMSDRFPSAQALYCDNQIFLVDCGEGTQSRLAQCKVKRSRINHIFISHLHGDHIFGLPGLVTSYNLYRRTEPLHIYGPFGIRSFIEGFIKTTSLELIFPLQVFEHSPQVQTVLMLDKVSVETIPLQHRIPCTGYLFREKVNARRIRKGAIEEFSIPVDKIGDLQSGMDFIMSDGSVIKNDMLTTRGRSPQTFAYCSDTSFSPAIVPIVREVDLLYHEATFGNDLKAKAAQRGHSTAAEAATIAHMANVRHLLIGHFSSRYTDPQVLGDEARKKFARTIVAREGMVLQFDNLAVEYS